MSVFIFFVQFIEQFYVWTFIAVDVRVPQSTKAMHELSVNALSLQITFSYGSEMQFSFRGIHCPLVRRQSILHLKLLKHLLGFQVIRFYCLFKSSIEESNRNESSIHNRHLTDTGDMLARPMLAVHSFSESKRSIHSNALPKQTLEYKNQFVSSTFSNILWILMLCIGWQEIKCVGAMSAFHRKDESIQQTSKC